MNQDITNGIKFTCESGISLDAVIASKPFQDWLASMDPVRFVIRGVHIQSVDMFGPRVGFVKFKADIVDQSGKYIPAITFMRGGAVGILPKFVCNGTSYAVLTVQPRVPTGQFDFVEIPAGMLDGSGNFAGVAAKELKEELGIEINDKELTDLSTPAGHTRGFFVSPGGSDETIRLFSFTRTVTEEELASMKGKCTGRLDEGEQITLKIVPFDDLWKIPDGKTVVAYALFQHLQKN